MKVKTFYKYHFFLKFVKINILNIPTIKRFLLLKSLCLKIKP